MKKARKLLAWVLLFCLILTGMPSLHSVAAETTGEAVVNVLDYGADPIGATDSAEAIWNALEAAKELEAAGNHVTVEFPKGEYHIYKDKAQTREYHTSNTNSIENPVKTIGLLIEEHENLTIDGNGSLFMMHGNMMALAVVKSENVTLKDFAWDFAVPTVTELTVTESGSNYTEFYIPECFPYTISGNTLVWSSELSPYTGQPYWTATGNHNTYAIIAYHPDDEMARNFGTDISPFTNASSITDMGNNIIRVNYSYKNTTQAEHHKVGTVFALCGNAHRETAGAFTWESKNVLAEGVNVHFMHGFGWLIQMSEDVTYRNCNLMPRENSGHMTVSFADGLHASGAAGEIVIENCNFSNTHDDPINFHGTFTRVEQRMDDHTLKLKYIHNQQGGFPQFHVGDEVQFFTRDTLESSDNETMYTVSEVVSNPGEDGNDLRTMVVRFEETLPEYLTATVSNGTPKYVAENVTYAPAVTIKNSTFKNVPTRGILCTTRQPVLIEGNTFLNMSMATIFLSNDSNDWYESGPIRDMTIRNNTFYIKTIGDTYWDYKSAIYIHPVTYGGGLPSEDNPIHKNITIEGNTFNMSDDTVVKAESVENLTIRDNTIVRTNPEFEIEIASGSTTLAVGETAALNTTADGTTIIGDNNKNLSDTTSRNYDNVFEFKACKNVIIEGNTYDDGMKNYAVISNMSESNLTNNDEEIKVVTSASEAASDPVSDLVYVSSNPDVVSVNADGQMTAKAAGSADVYAYYVWNNTVVKSNVVTMTVAGESTGETTDVQIAQEGTVVLNDETASAVLTANTDVTWSAVDFATGAATDVVTVAEDGTVAAVKNGIAWVKASANGSEDKIPVVVSLSKVEGLAPGFAMVREDAANYTTAADQITINMQSGDLWQWDNNLKNLLTYGNFDRTDLRTIVKVTGMPVRESNKWNTASFILRNDDDNYVTIGKKSHFDGIATVVEVGQSATEAGGDSAYNSTSEAYLGFTVTGSGSTASISMDYKVGDGEWTNAKSLTSSVLGDAYTIGFGTWGSGSPVTFSDFKVGKASEVSYTDLEAADALSIGEYTNEAPTVSDVAFDADSYHVGDKATVTYTYQDADGNAEGATLYLWTYDENGTEKTVVTNVPELTVTASGELSCEVYPVDALGTPGIPAKASVETVAGDANIALRSLCINGTELISETSGNAYEVVIPADLTMVDVSYQSLMASEGTTTVAVDGQEAVSKENTDSFGLDVTAGKTITITRSAADQDSIVYTVTLVPVESNATDIQGIEIPELGFAATDLSAGLWMVVTEEDSATIKVLADDTIGKVEVKYNNYREDIELTKTADGYEGTITFVNGLNSFYVRAIAKDGITYDQYNVNVVYTADTTSELQDLKINGTTITGFASDVYEYTVALSEGASSITVEAASDQAVRIRVNEEYIEGNTLDISNLTEGTYDVYVVTVADDGYVKTAYHAELFVPHESNVEVSKLTVNGEDMLGDADADGNIYAEVLGDTASIGVTTQDAGAVISVKSKGQAAEGTGTAETEINRVDKEEQAVTITITARDGVTTRVYTVYLVEKPLEPSDDDKDYDVSKITYSTGSEQPQSGNEGPIRFAFDNNHDTFWHSEWSPSWSSSAFADYLWVQFILEDATVVDAIRYLPRGGNGDITAYRVEAKTAESGDEWVTLTEGTWDRSVADWKLAQFEPVEVTALRLVATGTYSDTGSNKFASAKELRVRTAELPTVEPENPFEDVAEGDYFYDAVLWAVENGVTAGLTPTQFGPAENCTRAQVVTFLWNAAGKPAAETAENPFEDVAEGAYYYDAVLWAVENGITAGVNETTFAPDDVCTRGQVVSFLYRVAGEPDVTGLTCDFVDVGSDMYYYNAVLWAVAEGITSGHSETNFDPNADCIRAEIITFLYRYYA